MAPGDEPMNDGVVRLQAERLLQHGKRLVSISGHRGCGERQRAEIEIVGIEVVGPLAPGALDFGSPQGRLDGADHAHRHLVL